MQSSRQVFLVGFVAGAAVALCYTNVMAPILDERAKAKASAADVAVADSLAAAAREVARAARRKSPRKAHAAMAMPGYGSLKDSASRSYKNPANQSGDKLWSYSHSYQHAYAAHLAPYRLQPLRFLEIGLGCNMRYGAGLSLALWTDFMPHAKIYMAEFNAECVAKKRGEIASQFPRAHVLVGDAGDPETLRRWIQKTGGEFDFIVDDGSHWARHQWASLTTLWHALAPGGRFVMEDIGETRYSGYSAGFPLSDPPTFIGAIQGLIADLVEHGSGQSSRSLPKLGLHPHPLLHRRLPGLKSVECFAEVCVFVKCAGTAAEGRCP